MKASLNRQCNPILCLCVILIFILNPQLVNIGSQYTYGSEDQTEFLVVVSREFDALPVAEEGVCPEERVSCCVLNFCMFTCKPNIVSCESSWQHAGLSQY